MLTERLWQAFAWFVSLPAVSGWLIEVAKLSPDEEIRGPDGSLYMGRWWLLNPYDRETRAQRHSWLPFSVRVHYIARPDQGQDLHDHPWNARTVILRGAYVEERGHATHLFRWQGDTARLRFGEYHRITDVGSEGAWTLFIMGRYRGTWGFLVDGKKVPYKEYL